MKLIEKQFTQPMERAALKRSLRGIVSANNRNSIVKSRRNGRKRALIENYKAVAPSFLDLYKTKFHDPLVDFVNKIEKKATLSSSSRIIRIHICFRNTCYISAAAGLWLLSKMENLKFIHPYLKFSVTRPPALTPKGHKNKLPIVDSVLNRIGFYSALGLKKREMAELTFVKCWEVARGEKVVGSQVGELLTNITEKLGHDYSSLYRPMIEAMSNSVEHAYRDDLVDVKSKHIKNKWWCFAAIVENRLVFLICDLGVGIPKTLPFTQTNNIIKKLVEFMGRPLNSDVDYIKAALQVKKTRTDLSHRGKGGADLQSVIESTPNSRLCIMSNRGCYHYNNRDGKFLPEIMFDNKLSIGGTIVQWSVDLQSGEKL